jgi:hypothetical protein
MLLSTNTNGIQWHMPAELDNTERALSCYLSVCILNSRTDDSLREYHIFAKEYLLFCGGSFGAPLGNAYYSISDMYLFGARSLL